MPKTYSFSDISTPTALTATPVAGGTLVSGTTYYYRIIGVKSNSISYIWAGKSKASEEFSGTASGSNLSMSISFTMPAGEAVGYRIFRSTTPGGMLLSNSSQALSFIPSDATYRTGSTVTFIDTGYGNGSNSYLDITTDPHGVLTLSGSTALDPFSIVDLYNADVAAGWGVITRIDLQTYRVNCYIQSSGQFWTDTYKTIIFEDGINSASSTWKLGTISGSNRTSGSCTIIISSTWLSNLSFQSLTAYRTSFLNVLFTGYNGLGLVGGGFNSGIIQDCMIERFRNFVPALGCVLKNITYSSFDNAFANGAATFLNVRMLSGSRVFQTGGANQTIYAKGLYTESASAILWIGLNGTLNLVDSTIDNGGACNANSTGSVLNDKFSFNLNVTDNTGIALQSANVQVYDKDLNVVVNVNTDVNGNIVEQEITRRQYTVNNLTVSSPVNRYPFTIVISKTGYNNYIEKVSYLTTYPVIKTVALTATNTSNNTTIYGSTLIGTTLF